MAAKGAKLNYTVLAVFAPVLIVAGMLGFVLSDRGLLSGAPAYNVFHITFGLVGVALVLSKKRKLIRIFNLTFGLIDLYQAVASLAHLFPAVFFRWTRGDDLLHVLIGTGLVFASLYDRDEGQSASREERERL